MESGIENSKEGETDLLESGITPEPKSNGDSETGSSIAELRRIIVGSDEVSEVLPEAVSRSSRRNSDLSEATLPIVEENIRESVLRNPSVLADALFPVIGPAIRKAISAALSSMVQSFNQTLEYSVSPKGLRWRFEAFRTGRSFGEVVMLKTLQYRVEQVFLIHRETGLLLEHVAQNPQDTEDADMVSAMLTAIADFAHDSFKTDADATLDSFKISGLQVWIESSPDAILAAAIRGNPPQDLHETFAVAIEEIQYRFERELDAYDGEADSFIEARPILESCLMFQAADTSPPGRFSPSNVMLGFVGLILLAVVAYFGWDYWRWSGLVDDVRNKPGYVLTDYQRGWFSHSVEGLRDPLSVSPDTFLTDHNYDAEDVSFKWKAFQDTGSDFVIKRVEKLLSPPDGVTLDINRGILSVRGFVTDEWRNNAEKMTPLIMGVEEVRFETTRSGSPLSRIRSAGIPFECGTSKIASQEKLDRLSADVSKIAAQGRYYLEIVGMSDGKGATGASIGLNLQRTSVVSDAIRKKLKSDSLENAITLGASSSDELSEECKVIVKVTPK